MAIILPFPLARRRAFVRRQAAWYREQGHRAAERNLAHQLKLQRDVLLRRGVDPHVVAREIVALAAAVRLEAASCAGARA
jgi:hypothetical protein